MIKKIKLILLIGIILFIGIKAPKIKRYFVEERYYNIYVMLNLAKRCYNPYKDQDIIFKQEGFDYLTMNEAVVLNSLAKLSDQAIGNLRIPTITHQIYFTPPEQVQTLKKFYIEILKANFNRLNEINDNWQHNIWTNNPSIFPDELKQIKGVAIRDISIFQAHPLYQYLMMNIAKGKDLVAYFAESSDIFRLMLLQKFGGIYKDMDYEIYNTMKLFALMQSFDFIGGREKVDSYSYYGNSFIAAKPNHPIINEAIDKMLRNYELKAVPEYVVYPCRENDRLYFNGPPLITLAYFAKNNIDGNNDVILPFWMLLNQQFAQYKNPSCDYSKFVETPNLAQLIKEFSLNFKMQDIAAYYKIKNSYGKNPAERNIYYDSQYQEKYDIIGADMGCGTWVTATNPRYFYWK